MAVTTRDKPDARTPADMLERLGGVPPERIRTVPTPGTATAEDLIWWCDREGLYELVDGTLVEKAMGYYESTLAGVLIQLLRNFLDEHALGIVLAADGPFRLAVGVVRMPDVSFVSWERFPGRKLPRKPILDLAPDLAVEIISASNTDAEMQRKLQEYFTAGTRLVWYVYPRAKTVKVYTSPVEFSVLNIDDALDGGEVLPGFRLPIKDWFKRAG